MSELAGKKCVPCKGDVAPLRGEAIDRFLKQLSGWNVVNGHHIEKSYKFKNFVDALDFTNKVGEVAEEEGHHPDIHLSWGAVKLTLCTHSIDGLSESDFILAAKVDHIPH